jgi:hypothetical protein
MRSVGVRVTSVSVFDTCAAAAYAAMSVQPIASEAALPNW